MRLRDVPQEVWANTDRENLLDRSGIRCAIEIEEVRPVLDGHVGGSLAPLRELSGRLLRRLWLALTAAARSQQRVLGNEGRLGCTREFRCEELRWNLPAAQQRGTHARPEQPRCEQRRRRFRWKGGTHLRRLPVEENFRKEFWTFLGALQASNSTFPAVNGHSAGTYVTWKPWIFRTSLGSSASRSGRRRIESRAGYPCRRISWSGGSGSFCAIRSRRGCASCRAPRLARRGRRGRRAGEAAGEPH